jgi:hypothetical protein
MPMERLELVSVDKRVGFDGKVWLEQEIEDDGDYKIKIRKRSENL